MTPSLPLARRRIAFVVFNLLIVLIYVPVVITSFTDRVIAWSITEMLINYRVGFVRRGLLGELILAASQHTGVSPFVLCAIIVLIGTTLALAGMAYLLRDYRDRFPVVTALVLLSPALLLFPIYYYPVYLRKDVLVLLLLMVHAIVARHANRGKLTYTQFSLFHTVFLIPMLAVFMFVHELQLFLLPAHACVTFLVIRLNHWPAKRLLGLYLIPLLAVIAPILHPGNPAMAALMLERMKPIITIPAGQGMAITALGWKPIDSIRLSLQILTNAKSVAIYVICWILAMIVPAGTLGAIVAESQHDSRRLPRGMIIAMLAVLAIAPLPLFVLGWDFGRWIYLSAVSTTLVLLSIPIESTTPTPTRLERTFSRWWFVLFAIAYIVGWTLPCCVPDETVYEGAMIRTAINAFR